MYDPMSNYDLAHGVEWVLKDIRYSKSMLIGALKFWSNQLFQFYVRITRITNPLTPTKDIGESVCRDIDSIDAVVKTVKGFPDSFLYSHRYIQEFGKDVVYTSLKAFKNKDDPAVKLQLKLLDDKYESILGRGALKMQKQKMDPYGLVLAPFDIVFSVFPNEHPYIPRAIIAEVGMTSKGNTFVIKK